MSKLNRKSNGFINKIRRRRNKKEEYDKLKREECTFKPTTNKSYTTSNNKGKRYQELYNLSKVTKKEVNKEEEEYTFTPNIIKRLKPKESSPINLRTAAVIERLKKAREEKERVKKGTERDVDNAGMRFDIERNKFKSNCSPDKVHDNNKNKTLKRAMYNYVTYISPKAGCDLEQKRPNISKND